MKVLVVIDSLTLGGAERVLATLAGVVADVDVELEIVSLAPTTEDRRTMLPVLEASGLRPQFLPIGRVANPRSVTRLARVIARSGCDLVHAHLEAAIMLAPPAASIAGRPVVCTFHHVPGRLSRRAAWRERTAVAAANRSRQVIFVSEASRRGFAARYGRGSRWTVVRNGIDLGHFSPVGQMMPIDLGIGKGPTAVMVGAMRSGKGHEEMLQAWSHVAGALPEARLVLVGSGVLEAELRQRVETAGLGASVRFAGMRRDVDAIVRGADLVVLPSDSEALPTVLMEAAASGRPVVATRVGGTPEVVVDGVTGVLVPLGDVRAFADATLDLLADRTRAATMGSAAHAHAQKFDARTWAKELRAVYDGAMSRQEQVDVA